MGKARKERPPKDGTEGCRAAGRTPGGGQDQPPALSCSLKPTPLPNLTPQSQPWSPAPPQPGGPLPFSQTVPPLPAGQLQVKAPPSWSWQVPPYRQGWESQGLRGCWAPGGRGRRPGTRLGPVVGGRRVVGGPVVLLTGRLVWLGRRARGATEEAAVVALAVAAAGVAPVVAPVKKAGSQSVGRGMVRVPGRRAQGEAAGRGGASWVQDGRRSPKSMKRTCSCSGRRTPRGRRREAWIWRRRARPTSGALRLVAGEERH